MPGRKIPLVTGEYYHVFNRGVNKRPIYTNKRSYLRCLNQIIYYQHVKPPVKYSTFLRLKKDDQQKILDELGQKNEKYIEIIAFCLMPNHFHFLIKQIKDQGIAKFMSNFQNSYSRYFNTKYSRIGPLMQGKFKAVRIEDDEQLVHVSRYIHLNPYTGFLVKDTEELLNYPWSSLPEYLNTAPVQFTAKEEILNFFRENERYKQFILNQADYQRKLDQIKHLTLE